MALIIHHFVDHMSFIICWSCQMMSVHNERMVSEKILQALCDIACSAAYQIGQHVHKPFQKLFLKNVSFNQLFIFFMHVLSHQGKSAVWGVGPYFGRCHPRSHEYGCFICYALPLWESAAMVHRGRPAVSSLAQCASTIYCILLPSI